MKGEVRGEVLTIKYEKDAIIHRRKYKMESTRRLCFAY